MPRSRRFKHLLLKRIGIEPKYDTTVELADKRLVQRKLGLAEIEFDGMRRPVLVALSPDTEEPLLGYTTLENLELKVNPVTRKLEKAKAIEYYIKIMYHFRCAEN